jgi:hypothetical protein
LEQADRATLARVRAGLEALLSVGHQFEHLPATRERMAAMAASRVCREVFGPVRVHA